MSKLRYRICIIFVTWLVLLNYKKPLHKSQFWFNHASHLKEKEFFPLPYFIFAFTRNWRVKGFFSWTIATMKISSFGGKQKILGKFISYFHPFSISNLLNCSYHSVPFLMFFTGIEIWNWNSRVLGNQESWKSRVLGFVY